MTLADVGADIVSANKLAEIHAQREASRRRLAPRSPRSDRPEAEAAEPLNETVDIRGGAHARAR